MINGIAMKGRCIIIPFLLQQQILEKVHSNYMGIQKIRILVRQSLHWVNMNANIEKVIKWCATCFKYQQMQHIENTIPYDVLHRP